MLVQVNRYAPAMPTDPASLDLEALLDSWLLTLRAERKSPETLKAYGNGVRRFLRWAAENEREPCLDRRTLSEFTTDLLEGGSRPATAASRHLSVRRFSAWLAAEGEIEVDELLGARRPKVDEEVPDPLTEDEVRAMLATCRTRSLADRRDEAILRLMFETGIRAGECVGLHAVDVSLREGTALVRRGKGGKGRVVPFGPHTARAIDRYLRVRRAHVMAESPALWLGERRKGFTYFALYATLAKRAKAAGIEGFHPHRLRHTAAARWLAAGGSEGGLMAMAGWARPDMLHRYTRAGAQERAAAEARGLNLGEL